MTEPDPWSSPRRFLGRAGVTVVLAGAVAGLGAAAFGSLVHALTYALTGRAEFDPVGHPLLAGSGWWFVLVGPIAAGLVCGPLVSLLAPGSRGQGIAEVTDAVGLRAGRISLR